MERQNDEVNRYEKAVTYRGILTEKDNMKTEVRKRWWKGVMQHNS